MSVQPASDSIDFAERVLGLLRDGSFVATYKPAVLMGLTDLCVESGSAPELLTTDRLARKVIELYWPQTVQFDPILPLLRQAPGGSAVIVNRIHEFRQHYAGQGPGTLSAAAAADPTRHEQLVASVDAHLVRMPLPKLQRRGGDESRFIYDYAFTGPREQELKLVGDAGDFLVRLEGMLRPLIERFWSDQVRRLNHVELEQTRLDEFMFGSKRISLDPVRGPLAELQAGKCFYCDGTMTKVDIDHFLPWIRHPDNGIHNLVAAHPACNNDKRDQLAGSRHLKRWLVRIQQAESELLGIASERQWDCHEGRTLGTARNHYWNLKAGVKLWDGQGKVEDAEPATLRAALTNAGL